MTLDATHDWSDEERWSEAEAHGAVPQLLPAAQRDAHQPRRSGGAGDRYCVVHLYCYKPIVLLVGPAGQGEALLRGLDREIVSYKRLVQNNKQMLSSLRRRGRDRDAEPYRSASACRHTQTLFDICHAL